MRPAPAEDSWSTPGKSTRRLSATQILKHLRQRGVSYRDFFHDRSAVRPEEARALLLLQSKIPWNAAETALITRCAE